MWESSPLTLSRSSSLIWTSDTKKSSIKWSKSAILTSNFPLPTKTRHSCSNYIHPAMHHLHHLPQLHHLECNHVSLHELIYFPVFKVPTLINNNISPSWHIHYLPPSKREGKERKEGKKPEYLNSFFISPFLAAFFLSWTFLLPCVAFLFLLLPPSSFSSSFLLLLLSFSYFLSSSLRRLLPLKFIPLASI